MKVDNIVIHYYAMSPAIAKVGVNLRQGKKIVFQTALKDLDAARAWIDRVFPGVKARVIVHWGK